MNRTLLLVLALLPGFCAAPIAAHAATASADNIVIETGTVTFRIKHIDVIDTTLDNAALAALLDAKTPQPLPERFAAVTASAVAMPEVVAEMKRDGLVETAVYHDVKLADVKAGHVGTLSIAGASLTATTPKFDDLQGAMGAVTASDVDLGLLVRVATVARTDPAEPRKPLYASFAVQSFTVASQKTGFEFSIGPMTGTGAKGRALEIPLTALGGALAPQPGETPVATRARATRALVDMLGSLEFGTFEAKALVVRSTLPDKPATLSLARLALSDSGGAKLGSVSLEGFALEAPQATVHLGSLTLQNLDLAGLRQALAATETDAAASTMAHNLPATSGRLTMANLAADFATEGDGNSADGDRNSFQVARFAMTGARPDAATAVEFGAELDHFVMALPTRPGSTYKDIVALGYSKLDLSSRLGLAWSEARQELQLKTASLTGDGMGTLTLAGLFSNVTKDLFSSDPAVMQAAAIGMILNKVDLRIENTGLVDKIIARQARSEGSSVDDVRRAYVAGAGVAVPVMLGNGPGAKAIGAALAKFVAQPRSFHLVATAPNGLGASDLGALGDPAALLDKLDIQASANE